MKEIELPHLGKLHRKNHYAEGSFHHPAKMHPELARWIIQEYTLVGDMILDPMAGIGTTLIEGAMMGRYTYGIELERRWAELIIESSKMMATGITPVGNVKVVLGSAMATRSYNTLPICKMVIMSPPYGLDLHGGGIAKKQRPGGLTPYEHNKSKTNLGNHLLHTQDYQRGMYRVYRNCHKYVENNCTMALVTKNFYYKGELKRLDLKTIQLAEEAGWDFEKQIKFKLPYDSMWQKMYAKKYPDREIVKHEDILIFGK